MQSERLDISLSYYHHLNREHRAHILLLAGVMIAIIAIHLQQQLHFSFERFHIISFCFEMINILTMLFLFWVVQCANLPTSTYRLLTFGLILWIMGATVDIMDEIVAQPLWLATYGEDMLSSCGFMLSSIGILSTMHYLFHINTLLRQQALFDDLTKLPNRRYFHQQLFMEPDVCQALILLDIDHFKGINDKYGHDIGDQILRQFGKLLQLYCSPTSLAARIGGEEFALLLSAANEAELQQLANTLLTAARTITLAPAHTLTISLGLGSREPKESAASFFKRVDNALYGAKNAGRNTAMWAIPTKHGE